jgi:molybdopterin synthase catalytic subunit
MIVVVEICDGPVTQAVERRVVSQLDERAAALRAAASIGARVRFDGIVRRQEPRDGAGLGVLEALDYRVYEPMAQRELERIAREVGERAGVLAMAVIHSRGRVAVGETSFVLVVESAHRAPALLAAGEFIERMKADVPIWKTPVWAL